MKKQTVVKKTMAQSLADGSFIAISKEDVTRAGLEARIVMPKDDIKLTEIKGNFERLLSGVVSGVAWCQINKVKSGAAVSLAIAGFPPLAMVCVPYDPPKDYSPVVMVCRRKEDKPCKTK